MTKQRVSLGYTCQHCFGTGTIVGQKRSDRCPFCNGAGPLYEVAEEYRIAWNHAKSQYDVTFTLPRPIGATGKEPETLLQMIGTNSHCKCGGSLKMQNHSIAALSSGIQVQAEFVCTACSQGGSTRLSRWAYKLKSALGQVKRVKVGTDGVEIERQSEKRDEA